ncbi:MAG TPA: hypothetical protein VF189_04220 [Patescibacteria group bacterium]
MPQSELGPKKKKESLSHRLAHGLSDHISTPLINTFQYRSFENPKAHKKSIDAQMHRVFRRAGSSIGADYGNTMLFLSQATIGLALEHIPFAALSFLPVIGNHLVTYVPLPVDLHIHLAVPFADSGIAHLYNQLPIADIPKSINHDGNQWPIFPNTIVTAGLVNFPNAYHAIKDKRPGKRVWYSLSALLAPTHIPLIFNSFWGELATRAPQKHAEEAFAEKVGHVLSNKPVDTNPYPVQHKKHRFPGVDWVIDTKAKIKEVTSGDIDIHPGEREIFAQAVENRFNRRKTREWWGKKLAENAENTLNSRKLGLNHQNERATHHSNALSQNPNIIGRLYHGAWHKYHDHARERAEEKMVAIKTAQEFLRLTKTN